MQINFLTIIISSLVGFGLTYLVTGGLLWGGIMALLIGVGMFKWIRTQKNEHDGELEYDERVNNNIKKGSFQTFSIANLLLLVYLLIAELILDKYSVPTNMLIAYLCITFLISYYLVPLIMKRK